MNDFICYESHILLLVNVNVFIHSFHLFQRCAARDAGPDGSLVSTGACNLGVPGLNPNRYGY